MAKKPLTVETLTHDEATRKNAPTAELETFLDPAIKRPIQVAYERRNPDLDPQLVWRGKDMADWSDLVVEAPPLYIQEKIHPKALIEDLQLALGVEIIGCGGFEGGGLRFEESGREFIGKKAGHGGVHGERPQNRREIGWEGSEDGLQQNGAGERGEKRIESGKSECGSCA